MSQGKPHNTMDHNDSQAEVLTRDELLGHFRNPPYEYGPIDCWWWDAARLSKEKISLQLAEMKEKGVAGTWWYPKYVHGQPLQSDPPYWTEEWWDFTAFSVAEHQRLGMTSWVSDWTALGFFQNKVREECGQNPELIGRRLVLYERESFASFDQQIEIEIPAEEEILHAAAYQKTDTGLDYNSRQVLSDAIRDNRLTWRPEGVRAVSPGWVVVVITAQPHDLDYLNRAIVNRWLEIFLEVYETKLAHFVGNTWQAYGPDEMFVLDGNILYAPALVERFKVEKGYDPLPYLIGLFHDIGSKTDKIRCDYYDVMVSVLDENLYQPIADWLHERGMLYTTIATWGRQSPLGQTYHYGDFFRMMRHFDVTGNEDPRLSEVGERRFLDAKFSSSIAHLYQRDRAAVCGYWGSGWGVTQEQNLAWTNANYACGINLYNRHGVVHSLLGGWYEWVPPSVHFYQPYWQYWKSFTDYVRRLSYIMSQGKHQADVALLYPLTTLHADWAGGENFGPAARQAASKVMDLASTIYSSGIDFDFIDDPSLDRAEVSAGKLVVSGIEFRAVLLPPLTTICRETLKKLQEYYTAGGTVVALGQLPHASPEHGRYDPTVLSIVQEIFGVAPGTEPGGIVQSSNEQGGQAFFVPYDESQIPSVISNAIVRDVVVPEGDVFHTHQKTEEADIYFLVNMKPEKRRIAVTLRVRGEPEVWDPFTGEAVPVYRFEPAGNTTRVLLDMGPYQGVVLVFTSSQQRPRVMEDNLSSITDVTPGNGQIEVQGLCESGGKKRVRVAYEGTEYVAEADVDAPPAPIALDGVWDFQLEPTMDNRWADFRYPASEGLLGAEARRFRYSEETDQPGVSLGWHEQEYDDSDWPQVTYTYGPYWYTIGPFVEGQEPRELAKKAVEGEIDTHETLEVGGRAFRWEKFNFSRKYGHERPLPPPEPEGGLEGIPENFIVLEAVQGCKNAVRFLFAYVYALEEGEWTLDFGGKDKLARQAWVNGEQVISISEEEAEAQADLHLQQGWNSVLLRIVQPEGQAIQTYAVFFEPSAPPAAAPYVPLLRWFQEPQKLLFDVTPHKAHRVGWYRFVAPPGLKAMRLRLHARSVQAWVDGNPVTTEAIMCPEGSEQGSEIAMPCDVAIKGISQVVLRLGQRPGFYGGAAFSEPVACACDTGEIPLGDWCNYGLATYSGGAVYAKTVSLERRHLEGRIYLDLGKVATVAEVFVNGKPAGVKMARPFRFDISGLVAEGQNEIQVKVANTLANHMSTYPTQFIFEGQTVSGLLGPAKLEFIRKATMTAVPAAESTI